MSTDVLFVLIPVLLFALALGAGIARFFNGRGAKRKHSSVEGTILAARIQENDAGSVTQFYPVVDVSYTIEGRPWSAVNLPMARETHSDRAKAAALLADRLRPGQPITLEFDTADPGRVRIVSR